MDEGDSTLLQRWTAGDEAAGNVLFARHFDSVYRFFANKVSDGIEDLVQRTFLACVQGRERFRGESTFRTYLFQTARYQLYEQYRRNARGRALDFTTTSARDLGTSPTGLLLRREQERALAACLRELPVDQQIALELKYFEGLGEAEIADALELPRGTVASRVRRAQERLLELLSEQGIDGASRHHGEGDLRRWAAEIRDQLGPKKG